MTGFWKTNSTLSLGKKKKKKRRKGAYIYIHGMLGASSGLGGGGGFFRSEDVGSIVCIYSTLYRTCLIESVDERTEDVMYVWMDGWMDGYLCIYGWVRYNILCIAIIAS